MKEGIGTAYSNRRNSTKSVLEAWTLNSIKSNKYLKNVK